MFMYVLHIVHRLLEASWIAPAYIEPDVAETYPDVNDSGMPDELPECWVRYATEVWTQESPTVR